MSTNEHLSTEDRWAIIALHKHLHWKQTRIAEKIQCDQGTVSRIIEKWKTTGTIENLPGQGRKPLIDTTNIENNPLGNQIKKKRKATGKELAKQIKEEYDITISVATIQQLRRLLGFRPVHYRRRPVLSDNAKRKRLQYCLENIDSDWENIIFTDESMFILTDEHEVIWKQPGSPMIERPTEEYPEKVMIWGGIWYDGKTELCFIEGIVDQYKYQQIISKYLVQAELIEGSEVLQDGAKAHTAHSTLEFMDQKGIDLIQNPPSSPELNPIEKVWGWIKHEVNKHNPSTMIELKQLIQQYWDNIPQDTIRQFIKHNSTVVNDIIASAGGTITEPNRTRNHSSV